MLFWSQDFHIADITKEKMKYNENYKYFYLEDKIVNVGMDLELKIKRIKVPFLEIEFDVNKL